MNWVYINFQYRRESAGLAWSSWFLPRPLEPDVWRILESKTYWSTIILFMNNFLIIFIIITFIIISIALNIIVYLSYGINNFIDNINSALIFWFIIRSTFALYKSYSNFESICCKCFSFKFVFFCFLWLIYFNILFFPYQEQCSQNRLYLFAPNKAVILAFWFPNPSFGDDSLPQDESLEFVTLLGILCWLIDMSTFLFWGRNFIVITTSHQYSFLPSHPPILTFILENGLLSEGDFLESFFFFFYKK